MTAAPVGVNPPVIVCPDCGRTQRVQWQPGLTPWQRGRWQTECETRGCPNWKVTEYVEQEG